MTDHFVTTAHAHRIGSVRRRRGLRAMIALAGWVLALLVALWLVCLRRTLRRRMELVARACHELRRPVTAARLGVESVARGIADRQGALRAIELELASAGLALEDLEAALRGAHGPSRVAAVELRTLLVDTLAAFRPLARARGVELGLRWQGDPAAVAADRLRLSQATGNLIANAIEHGRGAIELRGSVDGDRVEIAVADQGIGLPAPLGKLTRARARGHPGEPGPRGHGLAIVADIAKRHGGELTATAGTGETRLALRLPRQQE